MLPLTSRRTMTHANRAYACLFSLAFLVAALVLGGCGGSSIGLPGGILYVASLTGDYVAAFDGLPSLTGNLPPDRVLVGLATDIDAPTPSGLTLDRERDILYVACTGGATSRVLAFAPASLADGNQAPTRRLAGAATTLAAPESIAIDTTRDILYVADTRRILSFGNASGVTGNVSPDRVLLLGADVQGLHADPATDRLYVSRSDSTVDIFEAASLVPSGATLPARRLVPIGASSTWGLTVDNARDVLYVADRDSNSVLAWGGAGTVNGILSPNRTLAGPQTLLNLPVALRVDVLRNELYVLQDATSPQDVKAWQSASTVDGEQPPNRLLGGGSTNFVSLSGLAIDLTR